MSGPNINKLVEQVMDSSGKTVSSAISSAVKMVVKQPKANKAPVKAKQYKTPKGGSKTKVTSSYPTRQRKTKKG